MAARWRLMASWLGAMIVLILFPCSCRMWSGSRGALRLPSPLRTARDHFSVMQLKPFVRPLRDAVSLLLTVGYGLACGNWGEARPDFRLYLFLRSHATQYGGCATL